MDNPTSPQNLGFMARTPAQFATLSEFAILEEIWKHESRTVRQLVDVLYPAATPSDLATVQKLLTRLSDKGLVLRNRETSPHSMTATMAKSELAKKELTAVVDKYGMSLEQITSA